MTACPLQAQAYDSDESLTEEDTAMTTPAADEVAYEPPTTGAGPCATARCGNQAQKYGPSNHGRPSSPLCNVCLAKVEANRRKPTS